MRVNNHRTATPQPCWGFSSRQSAPSNRFSDSGEPCLYPQLGYFTYRHMSDDLTFKFNFNDFCEAIAVSKEYPVFAARDLVSHFLLSKLNFGSDFKRFAAMQKLGGTRTRLYFKNLSEWETLFPSLPEQKKIAAFLGVVDAKIATLRAKVSGLETYKRGLMQALFSQRLRFTKPNGTAFPDWVEKPFAEIASRARSIFDPTRSDDRPTLVELENIESMTGKIIGESNLVGQVSLKTEFRAGEILFGKLRPYLRKFARPYFDGVCSSEIWVLRGTKTSNAFLYYLVQSSRFNRLANISSGSKMPRSDWATIADSGFELPHPDEQKKSPMPFLPWMPKFEPLQRKSLTWKHSRRVCFSRCLCKISHVQPSRSKLQFSDRRSEWFNLATGFHGKTLLGSIDCWKTQQNGRKGIRQTFNL